MVIQLPDGSVKFDFELCDGGETSIRLSSRVARELIDACRTVLSHEIAKPGANDRVLEVSIECVSSGLYAALEAGHPDWTADAIFSDITGMFFRAEVQPAAPAELKKLVAFARTRNYSYIFLHTGGPVWNELGRHT